MDFNKNKASDEIRAGKGRVKKKDTGDPRQSLGTTRLGSQPPADAQETPMTGQGGQTVELKPTSGETHRHRWNMIKRNSP